jgi:hypothetical protein
VRVLGYTSPKVLQLAVGGLMQPDEKERLRLLCEQAAAERDSQRLLQLIEAINQILAAKQARVSQGKS